MKNNELSDLSERIFPPFSLFLKISGVLLAIFVLILLSFAIYVYTGPRSLPSLASFLENQSKGYLPETAKLKIDKVQLEFDDTQFRIVTNIAGIHFQDPELGSFDLPSVHLYLDLIGWIPGSGRTILNLAITAPTFDLKKQMRENSFDVRALANLNSYLEKNKRKLLHLSFHMSNTSSEVDYFGQSRKIGVETLEIHPVLIENRFAVSIKGTFLVEGQSQDLDLTLGMDSNDALHVDLKVKFAEDSLFDGQFEIAFVKMEPTVKGSFFAKNIPLKLVQEYWPISVAKSAREWVFSHISEAQIYAAEGNIHVSNRMQETLPKEAIQVVLYLTKTNIQYLHSVPPVQDVNATLHIDAQGLKFEVSDAKILRSTISKVVGTIPEFNAKIVVLNVEGQVQGPLQDGVDLGFSHASAPNTELQNLRGSAASEFSLTVPFDDQKITLPRLNLLIHSDLTEVAADKIHANYNIAGGQFTVTLQNSLLNISGKATLDGQIPFDFNRVQNFLTDEKITSIKGLLPWQELSKLGFYSPSFFYGKFLLDLYRSEKGKEENTILQFDLSDTVVDLKSLGISKKQGEAGSIRVDINSKDEGDPSLRYLLKLSTVESSGTGKIAKSGSKLIELESVTMKVHGPAQEFAEFEFAYKDPKISVKAKDTGAALKVLALTDKVEKGVLNFDGEFLSDKLKGNLNLTKFEVKNIPFMVKILSLASLTLISFKGLQTTLANKGIEFEKLTSFFEYYEGKIQLTSLDANGPLIKVTAQGEIGLNGAPSKLSGAMIPANLINSVVNHVPVVGKKLGNPLAIHFDLEGPLGEPEVKVDLFKTLTPSALH